MARSLVVAIVGISILGSGAYGHSVCANAAHYTENTTLVTLCANVNTSTCSATNGYIWTSSQCRTRWPPDAAINVTATCLAAGGTPTDTLCSSYKAIIEASMSSLSISELNATTCPAFLMGTAWSTTFMLYAEVWPICCGGNLGMCQRSTQALCANDADYTPNKFASMRCLGVSQSTCNTESYWTWNAGDGGYCETYKMGAYHESTCTATMGGRVWKEGECSDYQATAAAQPFQYNISELTLATCPTFLNLSNTASLYQNYYPTLCCKGNHGKCQDTTKCFNPSDTKCPDTSCIKPTMTCGDSCNQQAKDYNSTYNWEDCAVGGGSGPESWVACNAECKGNITKIYNDLGCCTVPWLKYASGTPATWNALNNFTTITCNIAHPAACTAGPTAAPAPPTTIPPTTVTTVPGSTSGSGTVRTSVLAGLTIIAFALLVMK